MQICTPCAEPRRKGTRVLQTMVLKLCNCYSAVSCSMLPYASVVTCRRRLSLSMLPFLILPFCLLPVPMLPHASVVTCRRRLSQSEPCVLFRLVSTELLEGDFTLVPTPSIKRIRLHSPPRTRVLLHVAEYSAVSFFCQRVNAARQRLPLLFCNFSILFESMLRGRGF